jgi:hypothetical protein
MSDFGAINCKNLNILLKKKIDFLEKELPKLFFLLNENEVLLFKDII